MKSTSVRAQAKNSDGDELILHADSTELPVVPVRYLRDLHDFRPDLVDVVVAEVRAEAESRRDRQKTVNRYIFVERIFARLCALLIGAGGLFAGTYLGAIGAEWLGGVVVSVSLGTLALAFLGFRKTSESRRQPK